MKRNGEELLAGKYRIERVLGEWKLWDHVDAFLSLGVTQLVDRILETRQSSHPAACDPKPLPVRSLDRSQARDLLLLAACYDSSTAGGSDTFSTRSKR